ncbi:GntR family transcriptional regulator [Pseudalkalibacillus hwajinpoensis]|uniref:GntR family transcriptional regulator n=1 Tax=Guptibacillus hwajinpoensis TaxID=208199 RepID=UPI00325C2E35
MQTKYNRVKEIIKSKILDGTYIPHQKISSENELIKKFGVSRHTIRLAVGKLVEEGWLYREQGSGTFCAEQSARETISQTKSKKIAIITTYLSDYIFPSIIRGAESYLSHRDFQVSVYSTNNSVENERRILEKILAQKIDGVIIEPTKSAFLNPNLHYYFNLECLNIPYIMINAFYDELEPPSLIMNDEEGGYIQTDHLIQLGHRDILGFFKVDDVQGLKRMKGYIKAHRDHHLLVDPSNIITYNSEEKMTRPVKKLKEIVLRNNLPSAVVCYNDELAIMLLEVFRESNLRVPDDISIVGHDDSFLAQASEVKLTTIQHPKNKMGEDAAKMIIRLINNKVSKTKKDWAEVKTTVYRPVLTINQSTIGRNTEKNTSKLNVQ